MGKIPDRWLPYSSLGKLIAGTRFVAFKVPLNEGVNRNLPKEKRFSPALLMELCPKLSLVVDLTNTDKYYNKNVFTSNSIAHEKIFCPGKQVPPLALARKFNEIVDSFLSNNKNTDGVIGVHCTHGVNRTGYFICRYMIERMGMSPESAVTAFEEARGHVIERGNYVLELRKVGVGGSEGSEYYRNESNKRKAESNEDADDRLMEIRRQNINRNKNRNEWQSCNGNYYQDMYQRNPAINSGIDYGYDGPMPSRYGQPNRGRYGNYRGRGNYQNQHNQQRFLEDQGRAFRNQEEQSGSLSNHCQQRFGGKQEKSGSFSDHCQQRFGGKPEKSGSFSDHCQQRFGGNGERSSSFEIQKQQRFGGVQEQIGSFVNQNQRGYGGNHRTFKNRKWVNSALRKPASTGNHVIHKQEKMSE